jgi:hypothetical protein
MLAAKLPSAGQTTSPRQTLADAKVKSFQTPSNFAVGLTALRMKRRYLQHVRQQIAMNDNHAGKHRVLK